MVGVTLRVVPGGWPAEEEAAARVAEAVGIPFVLERAEEEFEGCVIRPFVESYLTGLTPNPCIQCNRFAKWKGILRAADRLGAEKVATGHYARVERLANGRWTVRQGAFPPKDQTYVLFRLSQEQLSRTVMPLGTFTSKEEVRRIAREAGIPAAEEPESQEICFVSGKEDHGAFIERWTGRPLPEGDFVDREGHVLGRHRGICRYTVGQRKGLGIALGHPVFVRRIDPERGQVVLTEEAELFREEIACDDLNWLAVPDLASGETFSARVRIRYHHAGEEAVVEGRPGGKVMVRFARPVRAPAPGQSAVFYDREGRVIGGGRIVREEDQEAL